MLGDIGGVLLTIVLIPLIVLGLIVIVFAGLVTECGEFIQSIVDFRQ